MVETQLWKAKHLEKLEALFPASVSFNSTEQAALQDELNTLREALQESAASEHGDDTKRYMEVEPTGPLLSTSKLTYFGEKAKSDGQLGAVSKKVG